MRKSILVVLDDHSSVLIPYAISAAKTLDARVTAIWPRRDASGLEDGSLEARLAAASGGADMRKALATQALETFAAASAHEGVEAEILLPDRGQDPIRDLTPAFARAFDLALVQQARAGEAPAHDDMAGELLAGSGRPVLVVPAIQRDPAGFKRVMVAWDGGAAAARAFGDATMILARAESVEIVSVTNAHASQAIVQGGERLAARLNRDGIAASFKRLPTEDDPANTLLSYIADVGADLLVAGGYGHSRRVEALFGGATRTFLTSMTLPLFLSR